MYLPYLVYIMHPVPIVPTVPTVPIVPIVITMACKVDFIGFPTNREYKITDVKMLRPPHPAQCQPGLDQWVTNGIRMEDRVLIKPWRSHQSPG